MGESKEDQRGTESLRERSSSDPSTEREKAQVASRRSLQVVGGEAGGSAVCREHQEPLKVFCKEDRALLCLVCDKSRQHRSHTVLPLEEAAQDYKNEIRMQLQSLKTERHAVQNYKALKQTSTKEYLEKIKTERQKMLQEFQKLHLFLEQQESLLLAQMGELEEEVEKTQKESDAQLSYTVSHIDALIRDLVEDYQRPAGEFLQDVNKSLSRCGIGKCCWPPESFLNQEKLYAVCQKNIALMENIQKFKETLAIELKRERRIPWVNAVRGEKADHQPQLIWPTMCTDVQNSSTKVNVMLDPRTANPKLFISRDWKRVRHGTHLQALPDNPERFDSEPFVLGYEGFYSGKHCWVVNIEEGQSWAVGIAKESVKRKGYVNLSPEQGIWAVEQCWGQFQALTSHWTTLSLRKKPRRIQVSLDYKRGQVAFFDADLAVPFFTFPPISFKQEKIYPWFWVGPGSQLSL